MSSERNTHVIREDSIIISQIGRIFCAVSAFTHSRMRTRTYLERMCDQLPRAFLHIFGCLIHLVYPRFVYGIKKS